MDKEKIIQLITGNISDESEKAAIINRIKENKENKQFYAQLKNIYALSRKSDGTIDADSEYSKLQRKTHTIFKKYIYEFARYAAIIVIASGLTLFIQDKYSGQGRTRQMNTVTCPAGQISELALSDGTKIWLNSGSKLIYPSGFNARQRSVQLEGEAFFEVTKNKRSPFLVKTKNLDIKVLGTSFNVEAYNGSQFKATLVEGKVELQNKNGIQISEMSPGQLARYDQKKQKILLSNVDTRLYSSWKEGKMTFFNEPLETIAQKLERWYNVKITFSSEDIKQYRYSSTILKSKPVDQVLEVIKLSSSIDYKTIVNPESKNEIILTKQK